MFKLVVLFLFSLLVSIHCEGPEIASRPADFLKDVPEQQGIIGDIVGSIAGMVKSTTGLLNDIVRQITRDNGLYNKLMKPLRGLLDNLTPKVGIDCMVDTMRVTGTCQTEEISSIIPYIGRLLREPASIFRSIFNAFEAYVNSANKQNGVVIDINIGIQVDSTLDNVLSSIMSALMNFANYSHQIFEGFIANLRTLKVLPDSTFTSLLNAVITAEYQVLTLMRDITNQLLRILHRLPEGTLRDSIPGQLLKIKTFTDNEVEFIRATFRDLGTKNSKLEADIAKWTGQVATQTGAEAAATQKKIDDATDEVSKNRQVIQVMRNLEDLARGISETIYKET